jgi:hypothetical protein
MLFGNYRRNWILFLLLQGAAFILVGCFQWHYDVTEGGIAFDRVRVEENGLLVGELKEDTLISGRLCKKGWIHVLSSGVPVAFTAARDFNAWRFTIPAGTWVFQNGAGVVTVCAFPRDLEVQGYVCRGSGGPKGVQTAFYADGSLKEFFLPHDTKIQGVPCRSGLINEAVELHPNGRLKACALSEDYVRDGRVYAKGTRLRFDRDGRIAP